VKKSEGTFSHFHTTQERDGQSDSHGIYQSITLLTSLWPGGQQLNTAAEINDKNNNNKQTNKAQTNNMHMYKCCVRYV